MHPALQKYPVGIEKWIPAIKQVALERCNWHSKRKYGMALFREPNVEMVLSKSIEDDMYTLTTKFHAPGIKKVIIVSVPKTWWDHLKGSLPRWVRWTLTRRPLRWIVKPPLWKIQEHTVGDIFPGLAMPDRYGHLVYYDMKSHEGEWAKYYEQERETLVHSHVSPQQLDLPVPADNQSFDSEEVSSRPKLHRWSAKGDVTDERKDWNQPSGITPKDLD